jgi:hypothetical protein
MGWFGFGLVKRSSRYFDPGDVQGIPGREGGSRDPVVEACLAEYHALREEMRWLREEAAQYQAFALAITATLGPLLGYELAKEPLWVVPTLTVIPLPFTVLGFLFFRLNLEVYIEAAYIRDRIRPLIVTRCPDAIPVLWSWEDFKDAKFRELAKVIMVGRVVGHRIALAMRVSLFLGPALAALVIDGILQLRRGTGLSHDYHPTGAFMLVAVLGVDVLFIALLLLVLQFYGDTAHLVLGNPQTSKRRLRSGNSGV